MPDIGKRESGQGTHSCYHICLWWCSECCKAWKFNAKTKTFKLLAHLIFGNLMSEKPIIQTEYTV